MDRYGRFLGIIYFNDKDVNLEMVLNGHAWVYRKYLRTIPKNIGIHIGMLKKMHEIARLGFGKILMFNHLGFGGL